MQMVEQDNFEQPYPRIKVGVLFLRRKRPGFDQQWGALIERRVRETLASGAWELFIPDVRVVDDASLRSALQALGEQRCDVLLALQTTTSDGRLAPVLAQLWPDPVVFWATPENQEGDKVSSCSLVGTHAFAANIRQLGGCFELVYGMPGDASTAGQLHDAVHVAFTRRVLRTGRAGLVGYHAPGFIDMHIDPFLLNRAIGTQLHHIGLKELLDGMEALPAADVECDVEMVKDLHLPVRGMDDGELLTASRYYLELTQLMRDESLDSLALRDWPELSDDVGQWPYLAMARMASAGAGLAVEGDVDGAVTCTLGTALGCGASTLTDWLEHDSGSITLWHAGNAPFQLCEPVGTEHGPTVARHFNNSKPAVVDAWLQAGIPVTLYRLWHCDGTYRMTAFDAESVRPRRHLSGTNGLVSVRGLDVHALFDELCHAGMPHHLALVSGHHCALLRRFARQARATWVG